MLIPLGSKWLLVFDNVDDPDILEDAWPRSDNGSVLITSRDSAIVGPEIQSMQIQPFTKEVGAAVLLRLLKRQAASSDESREVEEIIQVLGGLPLALNQMAGFMSQQRLSAKDFIPLYQRNSAKIDARKVKGSNEHTLSTLWEVSLTQLTGSSSTLLKLLAYLDPDQVHESVLIEGGKQLVEGEFEFLWDEME